MLEKIHEIQHFKLQLSFFSMYPVLEWGDRGMEEWRSGGMEEWRGGGMLARRRRRRRRGGVEEWMNKVMFLIAFMLNAYCLLLPDSVPLVFTPKQFFADCAEEVLVLELNEIDFELGASDNHLHCVINLLESRIEADLVLIVASTNGYPDIAFVRNYDRAYG